ELEMMDDVMAKLRNVIPMVIRLYSACIFWRLSMFKRLKEVGKLVGDEIRMVIGIGIVAGF
ncbi:hypothetical protein, partial [Corynebacterium parakroppenstedtii]